MPGKPNPEDGTAFVEKTERNIYTGTLGYTVGNI
jgi:hypothetical protein